MHGLERMVLAGLEVDEVAELMSRIAGHDIGAGGQRLAAEITAETDGNPFFVGQILRHLRESGAVEQDQDGRWHVLTSIADLGLPQSVHEVIARRVERLGGEAEAILTVAAVIGRSFDVKLLERLVGRGEDQLLAALEAATAGAVLIESSEAMGRFVFAHALIRHSLYETLSALRRARMHGQVAEALEQLSQSDPGAHVAELAHHWGMASDPAHAGKAVYYARLAGERALEQLAPHDAFRWFTQALDRRPGDDAQRCDVLTGLGQAQRQLGDGAFRDTLLEASAIAAAIRIARPVRSSPTRWGRPGRRAAATSKGWTRSSAR